MKKLISLFLALTLALGCLPALGEGFVNDYAAMNEVAASVLVLTLYDEDDKEIGTASGFMAFDERHAVTSFAVLEATRIEAVTDEGENLGTPKVLGCDSDCNLAILAFDEPTGLKPLELNEGGTVRRGAACVSIGAQGGMNSITTGHIATSITVKGLDLIQFTATISDGASGGALLDENGKVAAVTMFGLSGQIGYTVVQNMNFALSTRHALELWEFCKDDEPVELKDWGITDIGVDSPYDPRPNEFYIINESGYSANSLSFLNGQNRLKAWLKNGESVTIPLSESEAAREESFNIMLTLNVNGSAAFYNQTGWTMDQLRGHTFVIGYTSYPYTVTFTLKEDVDAADGARRHIKEAVEAQDDFEIPETLDRKRETPENLLIVVNETNMDIKSIRFSYRYKGKDRHDDCLKGKLHPGEYIIIELPEELKDIDPNMYCSLTISLENGRYTSIQTRDTSEFQGKVMIVKFNEETRSPYSEIQ